MVQVAQRRAHACPVRRRPRGAIPAPSFLCSPLMADSDKSTDELAGTEQPFVQHLMELRDRLMYGMAGLAVCMVILAIWPGPSGLIDLIAIPIRAHMPPDAKLIAVGVFSPFFIPLKLLAMAALLLSLPWWMSVSYTHLTLPTRELG